MRLRLFAATIAICAAAGLARAQDYPTRQVTIVVPVAAGGAVDFLARLVGNHLADKFGKPFVVENRPGAGLVTGTLSVAKAAPDGYTLVLGTSASHAINVALRKSLPYDPAKDFVPVAHIADSPFTLVVNPELSVNSVADLIAVAKSKPLTYATAGPGSPQHLMGEMLKSETGIEMTAVPYKGNIPALTDLVAGHVSVMFSDPSGVTMVAGGKVRALGVSSKSRVAVLPDVPPLAEAGLPGFDAVAWLILFAPNDTPAAIVNKLNAEISAFLKLPETKAAISKNGQIPNDSADVATLRRFIDVEIKRWSAVVQKAGVAGSQ